MKEKIKILRGGVNRNKKMTDRLCCFVYIGMLVLVIGTLCYGVAKGNIRMLTYPVDADGNLCGLGDASEFPFLYYTNYYFPIYKTCVKKCPIFDYNQMLGDPSNPETSSDSPDAIFYDSTNTTITIESLDTYLAQMMSDYGWQVKVLSSNRLRNLFGLRQINGESEETSWKGAEIKEGLDQETNFDSFKPKRSPQLPVTFENKGEFAQTSSRIAQETTSSSSEGSYLVNLDIPLENYITYTENYIPDCLTNSYVSSCGFNLDAGFNIFDTRECTFPFNLLISIGFFLKQSRVSATQLTLTSRLNSPTGYSLVSSLVWPMTFSSLGGFAFFLFSSASSCLYSSF